MTGFKPQFKTQRLLKSRFLKNLNTFPEMEESVLKARKAKRIWLDLHVSGSPDLLFARQTVK